MAIAYDNFSKSGNNGAANTANLSHTTSGTNRLLIVAVHTAAANNAVGSITYNGVGLTFIGGVNGAARRTELWYLLNPASGSNTTTVNVVGTLTAWSFSVASYTGVKQTSALDVSGTAVDASTMTVTLNTTIDKDWLIGGASTDGSGEGSAGTNTTFRGTENTGLDGMWICDSNADQTPAGSHSLTITGSVVGNGGMIVGAFAPIANTLTASTGSFALTFNDATLTKAKIFTATTKSFVLTFFDAILTLTGTHWTNQSKNTSTFTNQAKNTSTWSNQIKN